MITSINQLDLNKKYSYADYLTWKLKERVEIILGRIFRMTPAPSLLHQKVSRNILRDISVQLKNNPCQVFHAPFDVRFPKESGNDEDVFTVLQPDLTVICDDRKLDTRGCLGAPDLVIEILSHSSADKDLHEKYEIYQAAGVKEYWIVEPDTGVVNIFILGSGGNFFAEKPKSRQDIINSVAIPGLIVDLKEIFPAHWEEPEAVYGKEIRIDP